jgi:hypothetical protein
VPPAVTAASAAPAVGGDRAPGGGAVELQHHAHLVGQHQRLDAAAQGRLQLGRRGDVALPRVERDADLQPFTMHIGHRGRQRSSPDTREVGAVLGRRLALSFPVGTF